MINKSKFTRRSNLGVSWGAIVLAAAVMFVSPAHAAWDRTKPTAPRNFRVTQVTPFSVSLAWSPSTDNSGRFTYRLWSTAGATGSGITRVLPKAATSYNWTLAIHPRNTYTFGLYAVDDAGNVSSQVTVMATTPPDTIAPSVAPTITVEHVNSTYVKLRWGPAVDDGPYLFYEVWIDGQRHASTGTERSITIQQLQPLTTYVFTVRASDYGNNFSPFSAPATITTAAPNSVDTTPPTRPTDFVVWDQGCGEAHLFWTQSTDDFDAQALIRYDIYVDGMLDQSVIGKGTTVAYQGPNWVTVFDVVAVDTTGNQSGPATVDIVLAPCP